MFDDGPVPNRVRVKICGITHPADAEAAIACGAEALGLNCYPQSKRYLDLSRAHEWLVRLPLALNKIAVLVNPTWEEAIRVADLPFITGLQLHGNETSDFCAKLAARGIRFAKALRAMDASELAAASSYTTQTIVLDSSSSGSFGGTGTTFPWEVARRFREEWTNLRVILAGGLTPENVGRAVREVRPFAVDVTTGVESSPGRKDHELLRAFVRAAHEIASER